MTDVWLKHFNYLLFTTWTCNVILNYCYFLLIMISSEHIYDIKAYNSHCFSTVSAFLTVHCHSNINSQMFLSLLLPPSNMFVIHQWTTFHTTVRLSAKTSWTSGEGIVMAEPHSALLCHNKDRSREGLLNWKWLTSIIKQNIQCLWLNEERMCSHLIPKYFITLLSWWVFTRKMFREDQCHRQESACLRCYGIGRMPAVSS